MWELEDVPLYYIYRIIQFENVERAVEKLKAEEVKKAGAHGH